MSFVDAYTDFIFIEDQPEQADMIFLPGSAEGALPVRAAQLWKEGYAPLVLPSGKYSKLTGYFTGHGDHETEWDYFHEILLKEGVADHAILQEKQATYTYENAIFSRKLTATMFYFFQYRLNTCLMLIPVIQADAPGNHRAHKNLSLRVTDLIIKARTSCMRQVLRRY